MYPMNVCILDRNKIEQELKLCCIYEVVNVRIEQSDTFVYLKGYEEPFNSIFFDFYEDGKEIDIYEDSRFTPYLRH